MKSSCLPVLSPAGAGRRGTTGSPADRRISATVPTYRVKPHYYEWPGQDIDFRGPGDRAIINGMTVTDGLAFLRPLPGDGGSPGCGDGSVWMPARLSTSISDDVPPWQSEVRLPEDPR